MGHDGSMYWIWLSEVLKRAFTPTPRVTDMLQILAASALPAAAKFIGLELPQSAGDDALAYIGLVVACFLAIRLAWAPFAIWKDDRREVAQLKLELTKPERLELERMAKLRAKHRLKLGKQLWQMLAYLQMGQRDRATALYSKALQSAAGCGFGNRAFLALAHLGHVATEYDGGESHKSKSARIVAILQSYIHREEGSAERLFDLVNSLEGYHTQSPPGTESETQP